jgi:hypothetical protein
MKYKKSNALLALVLTLAVIPSVLAQPKDPLRFDLSITLVASPLGWAGTVDGDIVGTITIILLGAEFPGITEHYWEEWTIVTNDGTITVYQEGVWSFKSYKFKSNGYVTEATGAWEYLEGARVHTRGMTSPFPPPDPNDKVTAEAKVRVCGYSS